MLSNTSAEQLRVCCLMRKKAGNLRLDGLEFKICFLSDVR